MTGAGRLWGIAAIFLASMGTTTIDVDDVGPLFEMPIRQPLPEVLDFIL